MLRWIKGSLTLKWVFFSAFLATIPLAVAAYDAAPQWILAAFAMAILVNFLLMRRFLSPIKQLSGEMLKVSKGDLDVHIKLTTRDEIGDLTLSFNQMIQELKHSQEISKGAEERYRKLFEGSKDMVFITSLDGRFIDVNQAGVEMLGYSSKEELLRGYTRETYLYPREQRRFVKEITERGFVKDFEVTLKRKDGTPIDVLITSNVRRNDSGQIIGYEGIIKNISDRTRMEEELLHRKEEFQTLYDLSVLVNQTLDLEKVLPAALDKAASLIGFEMGAIYLLNENEGGLELKFSKGYSSDFADQVKLIQSGQGVSGKAIQLKQPLIVSIDEYPSSQFIPPLRDYGIQSLVGIPLLAKGKAIGAITLISRSSRDLTQREMRLLESVGNQIGLALENARLFSNVARAKSEWETTFDSVTDLITIRYKDYRILRANRAAFKRYGMTPKEMIGRKCYEVLYRREKPCENCYVSETFQMRKPAFGERKSDYLDGIFQYYTFPIYDESGGVIAVVDLAREITEEKRVEVEKEVINNINRLLASSLDVRQVLGSIHSELKRVLESERMTITLLEEGGEGFHYFALGEEGELKGLVEGGIEQEGARLREMIETDLPMIVGDTRESDSWFDQKLLKEGVRSILVFPLEYKGRIIGTVSFGSREAWHFTEDHIRFLSQVGAGLSISIENSLLLGQIKASEERYRTVVEGAHDGVGVIGDDFRLNYANERLAEILGYSREELIGMDFRNCLDGESWELVVSRYLRRQRGEEAPSRYEFSIRRKNGEVRNVEISSTIVKDSKGDVNTISFVKDITEKKRMEEQLLQTEKLRALGEMASGVAHDFNNALAAIIGNTQILLFTAEDKDLKETLQTIEKVAKDSAQTVRRLQDFTRRRVHQDLYQIDINGIVKDAIEITKPKWKDDLQGRGLQVEMVSNLGEIPPVAGIASELREVITNMIFNAIEAMPEGGRIEIRTFLKRENVHIRISDTGLGMSEELRKRVFEPFFTTKPFTNTGLGLSMSYGIIKRFGGDIEVESRFGHGASFTIMLPIGGEGKEEIFTLPQIKRGKEARILVIDDEESVRSVLGKILTQVNHQVTVANNGGEGIRLFKERKFDLVLTDLGMPGMSGWDVCRAIKEIDSRVPVGMITGWGMEVDLAKKEGSGLDFIISKPFDFHQILNLVAEKVESRGNEYIS
jgi:PAS domain S-box-containing protein